MKVLITFLISFVFAVGGALLKINNVKSLGNIFLLISIAMFVFFCVLVIKYIIKRNTN